MDLRKDDTWLFNARYDKSFTREHLSSWNTTVFGSFVNHRMDNLLKPLDPRTINAETEATTYNFGWRSEGVWNFKANTLYLGTDFRKEGAEGIRIREFLMGPNQGMVAQDNAWQDGAISKTGMFAEYQLRGKVWKYVLSSRVELNASDIGDPASEFTAQYATTSQTQLNPSISLGAQRNTENGARYGIWLARAQRSAGLAERYINFLPIGQDPYELLGNPELNPEVNYQLDVTYDWTEKNTKIGVDAFVSSLHNFISSVIDPTLTPRLPMSPGVRRFVNIDNAFKTGVEFSWTQRLLPQLQQQISLAYTYAQDLEREQPLPEIAPLDLRYALSGSFMEGKLKPELVFRQVLRQNRIAAEYGETETPSFSLLNLQTTYVPSENTRFTLGINNLLDTNYYEHLNRSVSGSINPIYAPGRNVFASVNFTL
jgi:iron complex outermembrane receptor protein